MNWGNDWLIVLISGRPLAFIHAKEGQRVSVPALHVISNSLMTSYSLKTSRIVWSVALMTKLKGAKLPHRHIYMKWACNKALHATVREQRSAEALDGITRASRHQWNKMGSSHHPTIMAPRRKWRRADEAVGGEGRRLAAGMQLQPNLSEHRARCRFLIKKKLTLCNDTVWKSQVLVWSVILRSCSFLFFLFWLKKTVNFFFAKTRDGRSCRRSKCVQVSSVILRCCSFLFSLAPAGRPEHSTQAACRAVPVENGALYKSPKRVLLD